MEDKMSVDERIATLKVKHTELENALDTEVGRPQPDHGLISNLKKQKLRIKDELAQLAGA
jgi:hypothetical protein